jgi:hypothetical protein
VASHEARSAGARSRRGGFEFEIQPLHSGINFIFACCIGYPRLRASINHFGSASRTQVEITNMVNQEHPWVSLRSGELIVEINPFGAALRILRDRAGRDLLWGGDPAVWSGRARFGCRETDSDADSRWSALPGSRFEMLSPSVFLSNTIE